MGGAGLAALVLAALGPQTSSEPLVGAGPGEDPTDRDAVALVESFVGVWDFELTPAGRTQPTRRGTRSYRRLDRAAPAPVLFWSETIAGDTVRLEGLFGYDAGADRFFEVGASSTGEAGLLVGRLTEAGEIEWRSGSGRDPVLGRTRVVDDATVEFVGPRFRVVFRRRGEGGPKR